jgi:hypothetical protein
MLAVGGAVLLLLCGSAAALLLLKAARPPRQEAGKSNPPDALPVAAQSTSPAVSPVAVPPQAPVDFQHAIEDYHDDPAVADGRYKGRRGVYSGMVEEASRRGDRWVIKFRRFEGNSVAIPGVGYHMGRPSEPLVYCHMAPGGVPEPNRIKVGVYCQVEGVMAGRVDDKTPRGRPGYEFHVRIDEGRIVGMNDPRAQTQPATSPSPSR